MRILRELGAPEGALDDFMEAIKPYASQEIIDAEKPPEYPLGAL